MPIVGWEQAGKALESHPSASHVERDVQDGRVIGVRALNGMHLLRYKLSRKNSTVLTMAAPK